MADLFGRMVVKSGPSESENKLSMLDMTEEKHDVCSSILQRTQLCQTILFEVRRFSRRAKLDVA